MHKLVVIFMFLLMLVSWSMRGFTQPNCPKEATATVISLQGTVTFDPTLNGSWHAAQLNETLCEGAKIWVKPDSRLSLALPGNDVLRLNENTVLTLKIIQLNQTSLLDVVKGFIHFISRKPKEVKIESGIANAAPLGTEFAFRVDDSKAALWVYEGGVKFYNQHGSVNLTSGQAAEAYLGKAPQIRIDIKPEDAVNWALYYPPLLPSSDVQKSADPAISAAINDYRKGRIDLALQRLNNLSPEQQTPYFHKVRGAMRLIVGQVDLAQQDIKAVQTNKPNDDDALALQSVIALTQNRKDEALGLAKQAIASDPQSATAFTALSYAEQGRFDLDKAQAAADKAAQLAPQDAMVLARKAELQLSKGLIEDSKQTVQQATKLDANLERTQTIKGFTYLMSMETKKAMQSFNKAIALDSASPLARLGLGLAKIRDGELEAGRSDLEIATNLDPNNSLIRSYLGKAYYEEKRSDRAESQFKLAKERDPKDPTPYFYEAIKKQTENRPVEALHEMQKAIEFNNNRAVYRSTLMLDSDNAARSASLGRIYNDLGFQQRGLLEGWNSINQDQTNYLAHRFLADNYVALPRHEISRLSELLKAQLLQPINITPVQPQAAESNILLLDGSGSYITSFNEYNPLFARNRFSLQTSGYYGSRDTLSDEVVHSGIWDRFSYSLGQFHYQTDGFRKNNDRQKDVYNVFAQAQLTDNLNTQIEFRQTVHEEGDLSQNFNKDSFISNQRTKEEINLIRSGLHYQFNENSGVLASIVHRTQSFTYGNSLSFGEKQGTQFELQHLYRNRFVDITAGMNYLIDDSLNIKINNSLFISGKTEHKAFYLYSNLHWIPNLVVSAGLSVDDYFRDDFSSKISRNPINHKLGLTWTPSEKTTIRFAIFQSLTRGIIQNQTLEPTQVAGFNQFYDDPEGSMARRIGMGIDHKIDSNIFLGAEYSQRYLKNVVPDASFDHLKWNEKSARAYVNWTPKEVFSTGLDYSYEEFDGNNRFILFGFNKLETHRAQLFGNFFHPSGFISKLILGYINQSGCFDTFVSNCAPGSSNFWLLDADIGYRFKQRHGLITFGIKNLLDEHFNYQATDTNQPILPQGRFLFGRLTLSF